jgi:hypothetical protein
MHSVNFSAEKTTRDQHKKSLREMVRIVSGEFIQAYKLQQINSSLGEMVAMARILLPKDA